MMTRLKVMQAVPGMVVGKDVVDRNGRVLLCAGSVLIPKHLKIFKSWGIAELTVDKPDSPDPTSPETKNNASPSQPPPESELEKRVTSLFQFTDLRHPAIRELFSLVLERKKASGS